MMEKNGLIRKVKLIAIISARVRIVVLSSSSESHFLIQFSGCTSLILIYLLNRSKGTNLSLITFTKKKVICWQGIVLSWKYFNDVNVSGLLADGEAKSSLLPKICHTYPITIKLGAVIPYLNKIQKIYELRDTTLEFCWHQHFFTGNQQILLYQEIRI